jgi:hypothetical protein
MHANTWRTAERALRSADNWVFIGYSLPAADYEFKYMLKRVQLSRSKPPKLVLITGGDTKAAEDTRLNYQKFFGPSLKAEGINVFAGGLDSRARTGLRKLGALHAIKFR